jgi:hypothetical protein
MQRRDRAPRARDDPRIGDQDIVFERQKERRRAESRLSVKAGQAFFVFLEKLALPRGFEPLLPA